MNSPSRLALAISALLLCLTARADLTHRYSFTNDASDSIAGANGTLLGGASIVSNALVLNGAGSYVDLPDGLLSSYLTVTLEFWVTDTGSGNWARICDFGSGTTSYLFMSLPSGVGNLRSAYTIDGGAAEQIVEWNGGRPPVGQQTHIVLTTDPFTRVGRLYVNGAQVGVNSNLTLAPVDLGVTTNVWLGRSQYGADPYFTGTIDEFRIYDTALSPEEVLANYLSGPEIIPVGPVYFASQPVDQSVTEQQSAGFSALAGGTPPVSVQWYRNGALLAGATNFSLTFTATLADSNAVYRLWATNVFNSVTCTAASSNATLRVFADTNPPVLLGAQGVFTNGANLFFSEPLLAGTATNKANYTVNGPSGAVTLNSAALDSSGTVVTLGTAPLLAGSNYTVVVSGVRDGSSRSNLIAPGSLATFFATVYTLADIGSPAIQGAFLAATNGGLTLAAGGTGIGGTADQFSFAYQTLTGDFDLQLRLGSLGLSDAWAEAGLMARDGLASNAVFAATLATPGQSGSYFAARSTAGAAATQAGSFPVNYPDTWLRLQRVGSSFNGYASLDGRSWTLLSTATIAASSALQVGIAVSSHNAAQTTSTFFDSAGNTANPVLNTAPPPFEPPGPSTRRTGLVFSEIMYHPKNPGTNSLEFVELYNSDLTYEDLGGYRLSGSIDFTFPPGTILPSGGYLVVARDPAAVQACYGLGGVLGPWTNSLPNDAGTVRLRNELDSVLLEVNYDTAPPWPAAPDGTGHSLVLRRPSYGENDPRAWAPSDVVGGSPGRADPWGYEPLRPVVINEFLAHTDLPDLDAIELFNSSTQALNLAGCVLTDDPDTNKFVIGSVNIPARGFVSFNETQLGFRLDASGETLYLKNPAGTRVLDAVRYEAQENGVSFGRYPNGGSQWYRMSAKTLGALNAAPLFNQVGINEIMYHPLSGSDDDQYVELYNRGTNAVNLGGWSFNAGISFSFSSNTVIAAGGYLVVAGDVPRTLTNYPALNPAVVVGNFGGHLSHGGERLALDMPDLLISTNGSGVVTTNIISIVVDEVTYGDGGRWGQWSDGGGSSLELTDPRGNKRFAASWADSDESAKAPWTLIERTDLATLGMGNGTSGNGTPNRFEFFLQGAGECLVDDVEARSNGGVNLITNPGFESGATGWAFQGTHARTSIETTLAPFSGAQSLRVRATGRGDTGANRIRTAITTVPVNSANQATLRARVRWLRGDPGILLRLRGNWLECAGTMTVPANLGTPGAVNSRYLTNAGPAIADVSHAPALPAAGAPVVVSARIDDPDSVGSATLFYRVDPATAYTSVPMLDNGTGGDAFSNDRVYSATIPGQAADTLVAFYIQAQDARFPPVAARFPADAPARECLVRFGETAGPGGLGKYRLWLTQSNLNYWATREKNSNDGIDATFVYGSGRVIYNAQTLYGGSPFHTPSYNGPLGSFVCNYNVELPPDDLVIGAGSFNLEGQSATEGNTFNNDITAQAETTAHWMARQLGIQPDYRRYVLVSLNGQQRGMIYYDYQQPDGDVVKEYFPDDADGHLHKIEDWFEFDDAGAGQSIVTATLQNFAVGGVKRTERYRWNWRPRATEAPNDFADLYALVDAANAAGPEPYTSATLGLADIPEWMRMFAVEHMSGDWDSYGYERGKNMFAYKPTQGPWRMLLWDIQLVFGKSSRGTSDSLFSVNDSVISRMYGHPPFAREYWAAFQELVNGPMLPANYYPLMDARYAALLAQGVPLADPISVKNWIDARRAFIVPQIPQSPFAVSGPASFSSTSNYITLTGSAPIGAGSILINGAAYPLTWTSVTNWSIRVALTTNSNPLVVQAVDRNGTVIGTNTITVTYTGGTVAPEGNVVFNEIMSRPALDGAGYVELFNSHSTYTFDLSNWRVNGLDYTFPPGATLPPRGYLVLAEDPYAFALAYGATNVPFGQVNGKLDADGETLTLFRPGPGTNEIVVDRVRYEAAAPWPASATNGTSLQLVDAAQDNSRVANWFVGSTNVPPPPPSLTLMAFTNVWKYNQTNNLDGANWTATNYGANWPSGAGLLAFENNAAITPLTNTWLTDTRIATNNLKSGHGDYFRATWNIASNLANYTVTANAYVDDGAVIYVNGVEIPTRIRMAAGAVTNASLASGTPTGGDVANADVFTIPSSYFVQGTNVIAAEVHQAATNSSDIVFGLRLVADYTATLPVSGVATPGVANSIAATLPAFPPLWLNEVQADNVSGPLDNFSQHDPWVELYNAGSNSFSLNGYYLSDSYTNLTKWAFPAGVSIPANSCLVVWCDNQTNQTAGSVVHAGFRLPSGFGSIALARITNGGPQVVDYLNYADLPSNWSYGDFPDGQPFFRSRFFFTTPGATNNGGSAPITIRINEWMADNTHTLADGADGNFEDWFELYNPGTNAVDVGGYYLTDNLTNKDQFLIPDNGHYVVPPHGFLVVWADNETGQNSTNRADLHAGFALSKGGEAIGLFAADGTTIDAVSFGAQTSDVSEGRFPDGAAPIYSMTTPTPCAPNVVPNTPPVLAAIGDRFVHAGQTVHFTATATDNESASQTLTFSLTNSPATAAINPAGGAFTWTTTNVVVPGVYSVTVRVADNGVPSLADARSFLVHVQPLPQFGGVTIAGSIHFSFTSLLGPSYQVEFKDNLLDPTWSPVGGVIVGTGGVINLSDTTAAPQRFYRIVVLP